MAYLLARLLVSAGLLAFAWDVRAQAPELAGGAVVAVANHWLPPTRIADTNGHANKASPSAREVA